jgi:hypothetical protein
MRWSIGFPRRTACQLSGWPYAAEGPAPGQRRPLVVSGVSRLAQQHRQLGDVGGVAPRLVAGGADWPRRFRAAVADRGNRRLLHRLVVSQFEFLGA